jgi:hypothetical protein
MFPLSSALLGAGGQGPATFIGALAYDTVISPTSFDLPPGTQAGDLCLIMIWAAYSENLATTGEVSGGDGGWSEHVLSWLYSDYHSSIVSKFLSAGDLAADLSITNGNCTIIVAVYRGVTGYSITTAGTIGDQSKVTLAGITKSATCKGLVTFAQDRDVNSNPTAPAGFTPRIGPRAGGAALFTGNLADLLTPASYINGTNVVWTNFITSTPQVGFLVQLTG